MNGMARDQAGAENGDHELGTPYPRIVIPTRTNWKRKPKATNSTTHDCLYNPTTLGCPQSRRHGWDSMADQIIEVPGPRSI
ncbi:hypothetical protein CRG98_038724 [Punica granatum]|uniref:Uncharacterized protein n=1 Tax=Punica granatum TaxID=22663 RepID=A0A2I0IAT2_PUNGR|nr:hypothetical protein CRG98_038724 [Punica granatum]